MLLPLSILSIYLLLLHSVTSVDLSDNKRRPLRHTQVIRTYNSNHPPIEATSDKILVALMYDNEEVIKVTNKNGEEADIVVEEEKPLKEASRAHPPARGLYPFAEIDDYKGGLNLKMRARSIKITANESDKTAEPSTESTPTRTVIRKQKRVQKVRKIDMNKRQLDVLVSEAEQTEKKLAQKEVTTIKRTRDPVVPIIESENYVFAHSGDFHYSYEGGDGTKAYERGELRSSNGGAGSAVEGKYSYTDKDGNDVSLSYTADENGYRPVGAHLPTPPPIPPAIARALAYLATKTTPEPITERIKTL